MYSLNKRRSFYSFTLSKKNLTIFISFYYFFCHSIANF